MPLSCLERGYRSFCELFLATTLGLMTLITFINVVLRYGVSDGLLFGMPPLWGEQWSAGLIWGLESTSFLFAWLIIFSMGYILQSQSHLGVDALVNILTPSWRKVCTFIAALACLIYALLLLKGSWDYYANFINLPQTTGRIIPTGMEAMKTSSFRAWYEVNDIPMWDWLRFIEPILNEGEAYEKLPRFIPYAILPLGSLLLAWGCLVSIKRVLTNRQGLIVVSHELQEELEQENSIAQNLKS